MPKHQSKRVVLFRQNRHYVAARNELRGLHRSFVYFCNHGSEVENDSDFLLRYSSIHDLVVEKLESEVLRLRSNYGLVEEKYNFMKLERDNVETNLLERIERQGGSLNKMRDENARLGSLLKKSDDDNMLLLSRITDKDVELNKIRDEHHQLVNREKKLTSKLERKEAELKRIRAILERIVRNRRSRCRPAPVRITETASTQTDA